MRRMLVKFRNSMTWVSQNYKSSIKEISKMMSFLPILAMIVCIGAIPVPQTSEVLSTILQPQMIQAAGQILTSPAVAANAPAIASSAVNIARDPQVSAASRTIGSTVLMAIANNLARGSAVQ